MCTEKCSDEPEQQRSMPCPSEWQTMKYKAHLRVYVEGTTQWFRGVQADKCSW